MVRQAQWIPFLRLANLDWKPSGRYWADHEWDVVSTSLDGDAMLIGECKSLSRAARPADIDKIIKRLLSKGLPPLQSTVQQNVIHAIFVPVAKLTGYTLPSHIHVIDGKQIFSALVQEA